MRQAAQEKGEDGEVIDILIPVLGRPQNAQLVVDSINAVTVAPHTVIFLATRGDEEEIEACKRTGCIVQLVDPGHGEYARKINFGVTLDYTDHPWVFLGADDLRFYPRWDSVAIEAGEAAEKPVVGTNDLGNATVMAGRHATHSLVRRSYAEQGTIDEPGKMLHEGYSHNWVDTEFIATAQKRDAFVFAADSHVEHLHPFWGKGTDDAIYEQGRRDYNADRRLFQKRRRSWR